MDQSGNWKTDSSGSLHASAEDQDQHDLRDEWERAEAEAENKWKENTDLVRDINNHQAIFGENSIKIRF